MHVAHVSMALYRLYGRREAYDALRELFARTIDQETPSFDDIGPKARFCDLPVCAMHLEKLLKMEAPQPGGGSTGSSAGSTAGAWSSSGTGGLPDSAAARVGGDGGTVAGFGAAGGAVGGGAVGGATWSEQDGTQAAMAIATAGRRSRRRVEGDFPGFSNPAPLARGSYPAATAAASGAAPFPRPELRPPVPGWGWGYPLDRRLAPQALPPPPPAPRNPLAVSPVKTSPPFEGLPQSQPLGAGPPTGLGMALVSVLGSAPAVGGFFDASSLAGARREQAALGCSGEGVQQPASQGGGGGIGSPDGADMTRNVAVAAWAGGNHRRDGDDGGWEGGARGSADIQYHREGAQHHRGREYGSDPVASSLPAAFTSTVGVDAAAHHQEQHRSSAITAAEFRGVNYGMLGVGDDSSPGPPPPAPDL